MGTEKYVGGLEKTDQLKAIDQIPGGIEVTQMAQEITTLVQGILALKDTEFDFEEWKDLLGRTARIAQNVTISPVWKVFVHLMEKGIAEALRIAQANPTMSHEEQGKFKRTWFANIVFQFDPIRLGVNETGQRRGVSNEAARKLMDTVVPIAVALKRKDFLEDIAVYRFNQDDDARKMFVEFHSKQFSS